MGKLFCIFGDWGWGEYFGYFGGVMAIVFYLDGKSLVSVSKDKNVKVW